MAETTSLGAIDINALMAKANAAVETNKQNLITAKKNAESKKLSEMTARVVKLNADNADAIAKKAANIAAYIEAEVLRQAESGKTNPQALNVYVKQYNSLVAEQTKFVDKANGLSDGSLKVDTKGKVVSTGKLVPKTPAQSTPPEINISVKGNNSNVLGPSYGNPPRSTSQELTLMNNAVASSESLESQANDVADNPGAFANWASKQITSWKTQKSTQGFNNKWEEIQTLLRETKRSKGNGPLGFVDASDLNGLKTAFQEAKASGNYLEFQLTQDYAYRAAKGLTASSSSGITKTLVSSLKLLDAGDASDKLSKAYYKAYGKYPSQKQITNFKDQWNQEAKNQLAQTASYRSKGMSKDITTGEGFTEAEQSDFLNRYLVKNLKMDAANLGGDTKKIYDEIRSVYRDNFLPEPEFAQVANVVKDLIGTADANVYNTKIAKVKETVGKQAAAFYPSLEKELLNGDSVETYASVYRNTLAKKWGVSAAALVNDKEAQDLIKSAVNFKTSDNKMRLMDNNEFNGLVQSTKRWKASEEAFTSYSNIGDKLINAFNLQAGVK